MEKETLEEAAERYLESKNWRNLGSFNQLQNIFTEGAKWQQEQDLNWFNEYQKVEDYIIEKIGDEFLKATPEKHKTASQSTIALLENKWQAERMYSEEEVLNLLYERESELNTHNSIFDYQDAKEWFEQFKKK